MLSLNRCTNDTKARFEKSNFFLKISRAVQKSLVIWATFAQRQPCRRIVIQSGHGGCERDRRSVLPGNALALPVLGGGPGPNPACERRRRYASLRCSPAQA